MPNIQQHLENNPKRQLLVSLFYCYKKEKSSCNRWTTTRAKELTHCPVSPDKKMRLFNIILKVCVAAFKRNPTEDVKASHSLKTKYHLKKKS